MMLQQLDIFIGFATVMLGVSLVITVLTQLISGFLGLRGSNLRWGIKTLLENASPDLKAHARNITDAVLNHQLISDSTFSRFADSKLLNRLRLATAIRSDELTAILERLANQSDPPDWARALKAELDKVKKTTESWFDRTMDRVSQRFATSMRYWTVAFSVAAAFGLHLDAVELYRKISTDPTVRAKLVASAETVVQQTANAIGADGATNVFRLSLEQLRANDPVATKALTNLPSFLTPATVNLWMRRQLDQDPNADKIMAEYQRLVTTNTFARAPELMGTVNLVRDELAAAGVQLIPDYSKIRMTPRSFLGVLLSAALLSLGAPFWFNGLKTLMNLRPVLAKSVQKETEDAKTPK